MHYLYLLRCADDSLYVGATSNLQAREQDHNDGRGGSYTAKRRPVRIVYAERHSSQQEALKRERQIKRWSLQKKESLVRGDVGLSQASSRGLASEPDSPGATGWPGRQNDGHSLPFGADNRGASVSCNFARGVARVLPIQAEVNRTVLNLAEATAAFHRDAMLDLAKRTVRAHG
jgi:putative endonuclease